MEIIYVKKGYNVNLPIVENLPLISEKFVFKTLNCFAYDCKMSIALVVNYLLRLSNYYMLSNNVKSINLQMLQRRFPDFVLYVYQYMSNIANFVRLRCKDKIIYICLNIIVQVTFNLTIFAFTYILVSLLFILAN